MYAASTTKSNSYVVFPSTLETVAYVVSERDVVGSVTVNVSTTASAFFKVTVAVSAVVFGESSIWLTTTLSLVTGATVSITLRPVPEMIAAVRFSSFANVISASLVATASALGSIIRTSTTASSNATTRDFIAFFMLVVLLYFNIVPPFDAAYS